MATETISLTELRPRLSDLVDRAHEHFDRFLITRRAAWAAELICSSVRCPTRRLLQKAADQLVLG